MSHEEAANLWRDIDNYRYGWVSANSIERWLADFGNFNLAGEDCHYIYDCFETRTEQGRITEQQFTSVLAGPVETVEESALEAKE